MAWGWRLASLVSAGIKRHHFGRFWCCQKRRRGPAGTRRRRPPAKPAAVGPRCFPAESVRPWAILSRRQHEQELWNNDRAWCLVSGLMDSITR
jgi:hypothetical protein